MPRIDSWSHWVGSAVLWVVLGCTVPGPDTLFPPEDVNTDASNNDFPVELQSIVAARCSGSGCHTGGSTAGGLDLTAGQEIANLVDVTATTNPNATLVVAGSPNDSYVIWRLRAMQGTTLMPPPYASKPEALEESEIVLFEQWITGLGAAPPTDDIVEPADVGADTVGDTENQQPSVAEIFSQHCNGCHVGDNPFQPPNLNADVYEENLINVPSVSDPNLLYVVPGDLENSYLLWRMEASNGTKIMPTSGPIPDDQLTVIKEWILTLPPPTCVPVCAGEPCSDDGCGGTCEGCPDGEACGSTGQCEPTIPADVADVFTQHCTICHQGSNPPVGLGLVANVAYTNLVNVPAAGDPSTLLVKPGDSGDSLLMWRLEGSKGQDLMPPGNKKIPDEDIETIEAWIDGLPLGGTP